MDLQALKLAIFICSSQNLLEIVCGISGYCRSRPVNMGDEPVNELTGDGGVQC